MKKLHIQLIAILIALIAVIALVYLFGNQRTEPIESTATEQRTPSMPIDEFVAKNISTLSRNVLCDVRHGREWRWYGEL
jgi:hypothetical protein